MSISIHATLNSVYYSTLHFIKGPQALPDNQSVNLVDFKSAMLKATPLAAFCLLIVAMPCQNKLEFILNYLPNFILLGCVAGLFLTIPSEKDTEII